MNVRLQPITEAPDKSSSSSHSNSSGSQVVQNGIQVDNRSVRINDPLDLNVGALIPSQSLGVSGNMRLNSEEVMDAFLTNQMVPQQKFSSLSIVASRNNMAENCLQDSH